MTIVFKLVSILMYVCFAIGLISYFYDSLLVLEKTETLTQARDRVVKGLKRFSVFTFISAILFVIRNLLSWQLNISPNDSINASPDFHEMLTISIIQSFCGAIFMILLMYFSISKILRRYRLELLTNKVENQ